MRTVRPKRSRSLAWLKSTPPWRENSAVGAHLNESLPRTSKSGSHYAPPTSGVMKNSKHASTASCNALGGRSRNMGETAASSSAERQRAFRSRRRDGTVLVSIDLSPAAIARLIAQGRMAEDQRCDRAAVTAALAAFVADALHAAAPAPELAALPTISSEPGALAQQLAAALERRRMARSERGNGRLHRCIDGICCGHSTLAARPA